MTPTAATPPRKLKPGEKRVYAVRVKDVEGDHPLHGSDWWRVKTFANPEGQWGTRGWANEVLERAKASYPHGRLMGHTFDEVVKAEPKLSDIDGTFILAWLKGDVVAINKVPAKYRDQYRDTLQRAALAAYRFGSPVWVNESFRTRAQQQHFYNLYLAGGNLAARPGESKHEVGLALDIPNARDIPKLIRELRKLNLIDDVASEPWHLTNHARR